ncbi:MAG: hypothetical protein E7403_05155 [Ruminococcaceae bacterium]|nr:hypothetical protein [Oscillospiraceae bacterium]
MDVKLEIFAGVVSEAIQQAIEYIHIDTDDIHSVALVILGEIKRIIQDETIEDDFFVVEEIVKDFEKYNIDAGIRHDFG